jgi:hypothetical protein
LTIIQQSLNANLNKLYFSKSQSNLVVSSNVIDSTHIVWSGYIKCIGFGCSSALHIAGSAVVRVPSVMCAAGCCQTSRTTLGCCHLSTGQVLASEVTVQSPVISIPVDSINSTHIVGRGDIKCIGLSCSSALHPASYAIVRVMCAARCCQAARTTLGCCHLSIGQIFTNEVTVQSPVISIPVDSVYSTHRVWCGDIKCVGFCCSSALYIAGSTIVRVPGVMCAAGCSQAARTTLGCYHLGIGQVFTGEIAVQSPVISIPVDRYSLGLC